jgi:hypothetical protein
MKFKQCSEVTNLNELLIALGNRKYVEHQSVLYFIKEGNLWYDNKRGEVGISNHRYLNSNSWNFPCSVFEQA